MNRLREKTAATLLIAIFMISVFSLGMVNAQLAIEIDLDKTNDGTSEWSYTYSHSGNYSVHLTTTANIAAPDEARIIITMPSGFVLGDLDTLSWWEFLVVGYPPHVDVFLDMGDSLNFEYAYNTLDHYAENGGLMPYGALTGDWYQTFGDDGNGPLQISNSSQAWPNSGPPGPPGSIELHTLAEWKEGITYAGGTIDADSVITRLEIEIDNWVVQSEAYVDDIEINGITYDLLSSPLTVDDDPGADFTTIQAAIDVAKPGETISVAAGTYSPFTIDGFTGPLTIMGIGEVIVEGVQSVATAYNNRDCVIFVDESTSVLLEGLSVQGQGLGTINAKNYGIIYEDSTGTIRDCEVSPNTVGDMNSVAIGIWDGSDVDVEFCTVHNYGRVGMLVYNGATVDISDSTFIGQVYDGEGEISYGIEVEGVMNNDTPATASHVTIVRTEVYNHDNTFSPAPSYESGGIYINGWMEYYPEADSTVEIENCDIHDNYVGIIVIKSPTSYAHHNDILDNRAYEVLTLPAHDDSSAVFDATLNWWGTTSSVEIAEMVNGPVDYSSWLPASIETYFLDTDGDTFTDIVEINLGTDPNDPNDYPGAPIDYIVTETVSGTGLIETDEVDVDYVVTDVTEITVAEYAEAPEDEGSFQGVGDYIDVHVDDPTKLDSIKITMTYDPLDVVGLEENLRMNYWTGSKWAPCSNSGVEIVPNEVWAILEDTTTPDLSYLSGGVFGPGTPSPVIVLSPDTGFATTITGDWFSTGTPVVTIKWNTMTMITFPTVVTVTPTGTFIAMVTALDADAGTYTITADDGLAPTASATFTVPDMTGDPGATGPQGPKGATGSRGATGSTGLTGPQGLDGVNGTDGLQGETGLQGVQGLRGVTGADGEDGVQGLQGLIGDTGLQGIQGSQGETGEQGLTGSKGATGARGEPAPAIVSYGGIIVGGVSLLGLLYLFFGKK